MFTEATEEQPDVMVDNCLSWILAIGQRGIEGRITPLRLELMRPARHRELLEKYFGCRVKFKAERNALVYRSTDPDLPFTTHNAELLAALGAQLDAELEAPHRRETSACLSQRGEGGCHVPLFEGIRQRSRGDLISAFTDAGSRLERR